MKQIGEFGGRPELAERERSLYPFAFSLTEEAGIIERLRARYEHLLKEREVPPSDSDFAPSDLMDSLDGGARSVLDR
jgi:hypothetical protein